MAYVTLTANIATARKHRLINHKNLSPRLSLFGSHDYSGRGSHAATRGTGHHEVERRPGDEIMSCVAVATCNVYLSGGTLNRLPPSVQELASFR